MYGVSLSFDSSHSTMSLVYPMSDSSCAFVNKNTVLTFNLSCTLPSFFDNSRTPYAISTSCLFVSIRDWVAGSFLVTTALSVLVSSLICCRLLIFDLRDRRSFSRRWWTKHAVFSLLSAEPVRAPRFGFSVVTREDLRRWALSASKTTYLGTSVWAMGVDGRDRGYLKSMLVLGFAAGVTMALRAVVSLLPLVR